MKKQDKFFTAPTLLGAKRRALRLTLKEMSELLGVRPGTYTSWEYGNTIPKGWRKDKLEELFPDLTLDELLRPTAVRVDTAGNVTILS